MESGFSVNGDILVENILESTVAAQCLVYEGIGRAGGVKKEKVTTGMVTKVKAAHRIMQAAKKMQIKRQVKHRRRGLRRESCSCH